MKLAHETHTYAIKKAGKYALTLIQTHRGLSLSSSRACFQFNLQALILSHFARAQGHVL